MDNNEIVRAEMEATADLLAEPGVFVVPVVSPGGLLVSRIYNTFADNGADLDGAA